MIEANKLKIVDILLVEDSKSDAYLIQEILKESSISHKIHWVKNVVEAIDFLHRQGDYTKVSRPDLILLDLNLPKKNGRELLIHLKGDEDLKTIPTIVLTTSVDQRDILASYQLQASCYLVKPIDLDNFIALIQSIEHFWLTTVTFPAKP
jgi:CheY-like chemotaxis protein